MKTRDLTRADFVLTPDEDHRNELSEKVRQMFGCTLDDDRCRVLTRTIDARQRRPKIRYLIECAERQDPFDSTFSAQFEFPKIDKRLPRVGVVGAGPAGMFCAWRLRMLGCPVVVLERGGDVRARRPELARINREGVLNTENNYCFGEGGAGTFSDGKLYTRSTKKGHLRDILEVLVGVGAPPRILTDARPHIGTNKLPKVIQSFREILIEAGVVFHFHCRLDDWSKDGQNLVLKTSNQGAISVGAMVLATGHSANDTYDLVLRKGLNVVPKPFAMGVRVEHPQALIDEIQYGTYAGHPSLGAAPYRLKRTVDSIGTFSFCMCPGGFIVSSTTAENQVVVNGMSPSRRNSKYANSGMVVSVAERQFEGDARRALLFQTDLEKRAFTWGGGLYRAPAQRLTDFVDGNVSTSLPDCSYRPGLTSVPLHSLLPDWMSAELRSAFRFFDEKKMKGYLTQEAVVCGVESRSSSAVRIQRAKETLMSTEVKGIFPCGEGAGYAGGIMSAAVDGIRCADAAVHYISTCD